MGPSKKYELVIEAMKKDFEDWDLKPDDPFLTDKAAIERYGVSRITIRRAFQKLEEDGYVYRIRGRGTLVSHAHGCKTRLYAFLGQCLVSNGLEPILIKGIEDYLIGHNSCLIICNTENDFDRAAQYILRLTQTAIDGIIFAPMLAPPEQNIKLANMMFDRKIPFVLVERRIPGLEDRTCSVAGDSQSGLSQMMDHLLALGHQRIAFFRSIELDHCTSLKERHDVYLKALRDAGITPDPDLDGFSSLSTALLQLRRWVSMTDPPTAIVVDNDATLGEIMKVALDMGLDIPGDISMAGFDDLNNISMPIPQTTIHVPHFEVGRTAAMQLINMAQNQTIHSPHVRLPVSLKIRTTTGINPRFAKAIS